MLSRPAASHLLCLLLLVLLSGCSRIAADAHSRFRVAAPEPGAVFVHLFEWTWPDVALECERVLGPAGIRAVQVSPPNEHIDSRLVEAPFTHAWWTRYQPVSYRLESRSGTSSQFDEMVQRCTAAGVGIYADAVMNHMGDKAGVGVAGSVFDRASLHYPDYRPASFARANCALGASDPAYEAADDPAIMKERARRVRTCDLYGLPVLDLSRPEVQATLADYLQTLLTHGVTGLRIDGAKHMYPEHIAAILNRLDGQAYVFQEVIDDGAQSVKATEYIATSPVTEFLYGHRIGKAFANGRLADLRHVTDGLLPSERALAFLDNHDNQRGHGMAAPLTHRDGKRYTLANVFMLAWPYGYTRIMSSYAWGDDDNAGPPHLGNGATLPVYRQDGSDNCGDTTWLCEHRDPVTLAMVGFRGAMASQGANEVAHWWDNGGAQIAFARDNNGQSAGFVAINIDDHALEARLQTGLPAGPYCDLIRGETEPAACSNPIRVSQDGFVTLNLPPGSALVIQQPAVQERP